MAPETNVSAEELAAEARVEFGEEDHRVAARLIAGGVGLSLRPARLRAAAGGGLRAELHRQCEERRPAKRQP